MCQLSVRRGAPLGARRVSIARPASHLDTSTTLALMSDTVESAAQPAPPYSGRTAWARSLERPLVDFMRTEAGCAAFLLAATLVALVWVNVDRGSYESLWHTRLSIRLGVHGISLDLRHWVNAGLMTFFFFVVGLEARREFDIGELRERRRLAL